MSKVKERSQHLTSQQNIFDGKHSLILNYLKFTTLKLIIE